MVVVLSIGKLARGSEGYYLNAVAKGVEDDYLGSGEALCRRQRHKMCCRENPSWEAWSCVAAAWPGETKFPGELARLFEEHAATAAKWRPPPRAVCRSRRAQRNCQGRAARKVLRGGVRTTSWLPRPSFGSTGMAP